MKAPTRRTTPASMRATNGRTIITDANGSEHEFRGATLAELAVTAGKLEADAIWAAKKAEYLRAAIAMQMEGKRPAIVTDAIGPNGAVFVTVPAVSL